jgi:dipeptidyl aminopeptidase/acylaminoacyl peptidase
MTTETVPFTLPSPAGALLHGLLDLPAGPVEPGGRPAVVVCHGFKGFMEWGFFPVVADLLAQRGYAVVRFNFSGSGMRPGDDLASDPDGFKANTHSRELADLLAVLAALGTEIAPSQIDRGRIGLFGHSRGGGAALLAAAHPDWRERLRALVTWAAVATFDRYGPEQKAAWRADGELPVVNARTGQQLALGVGLLDDLEAHREALDLERAAVERRAPWLIVHGEADESVPMAEGDRLFEGARGTREVVFLPEAGHTFGARHPFAGPTPHLTTALNETQRWFRRFV